jgi:hypothetical protein
MMNLVFRMATSDKQKRLAQQGCVFRGQELLDSHELALKSRVTAAGH